MGFDDLWAKAWTRGRKWDPLTHRAIEGVVKQDSKGVRELSRGLAKVTGGEGSWLGRRFGDLGDEADKNVNDPKRGVGRAAATVGLLYGGAALAGAGGGAAGGAGAGLGETAGVVGGGAEGFGAAGGLGAAGGGGLGATEGVVGAGGAEGAGITQAAGGGAPGWMNWARQGMNMMKGQGGGGQAQQDKLLRQMRLAEIMRQSAAYTQAHDEDMV